jgi:hypothetical protein
MEFFGFKSRTTLYEWEKDESRHSLKLIKKMFSESELNEFIKNNKIDKYEHFDEIHEEYTKGYHDVEIYCHNKRNSDDKQVRDTYFLYGSFLKSIALEHRHLTWSNLEQFTKNKEEIHSFFMKRFAIYLIEHDIGNIGDIMATINNDFRYLPSNYGFYYYKHYMWTYMPSPAEKHVKKSNEVFNNLPVYLQKIPGVFSLIHIGGLKEFYFDE